MSDSEHSGSDHEDEDDVIVDDEEIDLGQVPFPNKIFLNFDIVSSRECFSSIFLPNSL